MAMEELSNIAAGEPLERGTPCTVRGGFAYLAEDGEAPTCVCKVDCTTNASGVLAPIGESD